MQRTGGSAVRRARFDDPIRVIDDLGPMMRTVRVLCVAVLVVGVVAVIVESVGDDAAVDASATPTTEAPLVLGAVVPPSAPEALAEGARVGDGGPGEPTPSSSTETTTTEPGAETATGWPALTGDGSARIVVTPRGVVVPVVRDNGDGTFVVVSPCGNETTVGGRPFPGAHVVLDPGHGGADSGTAGESGLAEKDVNLAVAATAIRELEATGAVVVVTRTFDYTLRDDVRARIVTALDPVAFVTLHHGGPAERPTAGPPVEASFTAVAESRRLAGLLVEELRAELARFSVDWSGGADAGAHPLVAGDGHHELLGRVSVRAGASVDVASVAGSAQEELLASDELHRAESAALVRAIERFAFTGDPGSGFVDAVAPETSDDNVDVECVDPPLA